MKNIIRNLLIFLFFVSIFISISYVQAAPNLSDWNVKLNEGAKATDVYKTKFQDDNNETLKTKFALAYYVGKVLLIIPFLGVLFIMQAVIAGYQWMTAAGNAEQTGKAKKRIMYAVIGIFILASMYGLAKFIIDMLVGVTGYKG